MFYIDGKPYILVDQWDGLIPFPLEHGAYIQENAANRWSITNGEIGEDERVLFTCCNEADVYDTMSRLAEALNRGDNYFDPEPGKGLDTAKPSVLE